MPQQLELVIYLAIVALCLYGCYLLSKYIANKMNHTISGKKIKVIERVAFGQDKCLAICNVCGSFYLIGISNQTIKILAQLNDSHFEEESVNEKPSFIDFFQASMKARSNKKNQ